MLFSAASLDEQFAVSRGFSNSCLGQHLIHTTWKLSDRNVGCTFDAVPEHGSKKYLNLCQIQKQCQEPKIEIHNCRPARQALSCKPLQKYVPQAQINNNLSFQACLASPFGISCVPNSTVPQIHYRPARQALCSTSPVLETPVKIRPSSPNIYSRPARQALL